MFELPNNFERKKIQTTNIIANALTSFDLDSLVNSLDFDFEASKIKVSEDFDSHERKEKNIPKIIYDVLKQESNTFTKFVKRSYVETDAWLVSVEQKESECLEDSGYDVYEDNSKDSCENFVKIHAPKIFVRTLALPMIYRNH